jgi:hypothetical protein
MKRYLLVVAIALCAVLGNAFAQATNIPILNPQFNTDELACSPGSDCYGNAGITGWICGPTVSVTKMSTAQYPNAPSTGLTVGAIGNTTGSGSVLQTLGATVQANTTYTLVVKVGARADFAFTGYNAVLMAGNVILAANNSATPLAGTFVTDLVVYKSGANPPQLGQPLQVFVKSTGAGQINVSGVSLTATPE